MDVPGEITDQKNKYQQKLGDILSVKLTAENIDTYSDDALNGLIDLVDEIKKDPAYEWSYTLGVSTKEQEDEMFQQILGIDVASALESIIKLGDDIARLDNIIGGCRQDKEPRVYIPTDKLGYTALVANGGDFSVQIVPKTKTALFLLENDFGVNLYDEAEFQMFTGIITRGMMRQTSYDIINLPCLNRAIASCDETGNVTFVFNTSAFEKNGISLDDIKAMTKQDIRDLLEEHPELGVSLRYSKNYLANLARLIEKPTRKLAKQIEADPDRPNDGREYLKEAVTERAPEGWETIGGFLEKYKPPVADATLRKLVAESGIAPRYFVMKGHEYSYYMVEELMRIVESLSNVENTPAGWITIKGFAEKRDIDRVTLKRLVKKEGLVPKEFRIKEGNVCLHYRIEDLVRVANQLLGVETVPEGEGWITLSEFAKKHKGEISYPTIAKYASEAGLESRYFRQKGLRHKVLYYKEEDLLKILRERARKK